jgi:NADPH:quinone reductase-like Zn-dependent oxidoreductase
MAANYAACFAEAPSRWMLCTKAMRAELKPGDIVLIEAGAGVGMTVRYLLRKRCF